MLLVGAVLLSGSGQSLRRFPVITATYFILVGLGRFVEEHYQRRQTAVVAGLRIYQWLAIAFVVGAGIGLTTFGATTAPPGRSTQSKGRCDGAHGRSDNIHVPLGVDFPKSNRRARDRTGGSGRELRLLRTSTKCDGSPMAGRWQWRGDITRNLLISEPGTMDKLTTTIKRERQRETIAGRKRVGVSTAQARIGCKSWRQP